MQNENRVAYVIGNGDYDDSPIKKATANAQKMKDFLQEYNFDVTYAEDASKRDIIKGLRSFTSNMKSNGVALFYFCGHMIQVKGTNYLIPIEASIESDYHVLYEAIELNAILKKMYKNGNRLNIIIIDSSYKNPFGDRYRAKKQGIAKFKRRRNTDLILATGPNKIVKTYPFTDKLISILSVKGTSNLEGFNTFQKHFKQSYFLESKQAFYFNLPDKLVDPEIKLWLDTVKLNSIVSYSHYLKKFPAGRYVRQATLNLTALKNREQFELSLESKGLKEGSTEPEVQTLNKEQALKREQEQKLLLEQEKRKEEALLAAALKEEERIKRENTHFIEPVMVLIKAGSYMMGSGFEAADEAPQHKEHIDKDFFMGKYEVSNVEYKEFLAATNRKKEIPENWSADTQPVIGVTWDDAVAYAAWLSDLSGKTYRLPTEQEWEYAARAEVNTRYYWGDDDGRHIEKSFWKEHEHQIPDDYAWIKTNSNNIVHTVGSKKPNAWGLHDTAGNVWEWCLNPYTKNYKSAPEDKNLKVIRGGSWFSTPDEITLSHRGSNVNDFSSYNIGFRLLREK